ncbi:MAG: Bax inhibitor-1/YccA family protein [Actinomycetota bacterium]|nr:Bax inhibitor-1/YccA family protein [Actinomycetota bacterium]
MANPLLNDRALERAQPGWAAPAAPSNTWPAPGPTRTADGPVSQYEGAMTVSGTITASAVLFTLLLISAVFGWNATDTNLEGELSFPGIALVGVAVGFGCVIALFFKPQWARVLGPVYALAQGFFVGAISKAYNTFNDGIVLQAVGATAATFAVMLVLHRTRIIKVTDRFRRIVIGATMGVMVLYLFTFVFSMFGFDAAFFREPNALGIGFSIFVCGLAALNLSLDFDFIERGSNSGLPKHFEWYGAFGLLVTVVWLYLELLRLLALLQGRD